MLQLLDCSIEDTQRFGNHTKYSHLTYIHSLDYIGDLFLHTLSGRLQYTVWTCCDDQDAADYTPSVILCMGPHLANKTHNRGYKESATCALTVLCVDGYRPQSRDTIASAATAAAATPSTQHKVARAAFRRSHICHWDHHLQLASPP